MGRGHLHGHMSAVSPMEGVVLRGWGAAVVAERWQQVLGSRGNPEQVHLEWLGSWGWAAGLEVASQEWTLGVVPEDKNGGLALALTCRDSEDDPGVAGRSSGGLPLHRSSGPAW